MKHNEFFDKNPHALEGYNYREYAKDLEQMQKDLLNAAGIYIGIGILLFLLLLKTWQESQTIFTLTGLFIGGIFGLIISLRGVGLPNRLTTYGRWGGPKQLTVYEQRFQSVMRRFRKRKLVVVLLLPYFIWITYLYSISRLPMDNNYSEFIFITLFSALVVSGFVMGVQYFQIYRSIYKEIMNHKLENVKYSKELSSARKWIILSLLLFTGSFVVYFYPFLKSQKSFTEWIISESYKPHFAGYWVNQLFSPLILLISLSYLIYGTYTYISLRKKVKANALGN